MDSLSILVVEKSDNLEVFENDILNVSFDNLIVLYETEKNKEKIRKINLIKYKKNIRFLKKELYTETVDQGVELISSKAYELGWNFILYSNEVLSGDVDDLNLIRGRQDIFTGVIVQKKLMQTDSSIGAFTVYIPCERLFHSNGVKSERRVLLNLNVSDSVYEKYSSIVELSDRDIFLSSYAESKKDWEKKIDYALALALSGELEKSFKYFIESTKENSSEKAKPSITLRLSQIFCDEKQYTRAYDILRYADEETKKFAEYWFQKSIILLNNGDQDELDVHSRAKDIRRCLILCLRIGEKKEKKTGMGSYLPAHNLAAFYFASGNTIKARYYASLAMNMKKNSKNLF